ncbi:MAG: ParB N-terminal domain-containing protein [Sphaerochaetaceae bacterium]|nr:ParB N-terminal domain-containing protein [Sphaerochaetaceae bacterium]
MKTYDINIFKNFKGQRPVSPAHVSKLQKSIEKKNMLESCPIIVTPAMEVIDGQHRLQAVRQIMEKDPEKKIAIHYVINERCTRHDIITFNANQSSWSLADYMNYYADWNNPSYKFMRKILKNYHVPISALLNIVLKYIPGDSKNTLQKYKDGYLTIDITDQKKLENYFNITKFNIQNAVASIRAVKPEIKVATFWSQAWQLAFHKIYESLGEQALTEVWEAVCSNPSKFSNARTVKDALCHLIGWVKPRSHLRKNLEKMVS